MYLRKTAEIAGPCGVFYALLSAVPTLYERPCRTHDVLLEGEPRSPIDLLPGCSFAGRCREALALCRDADPS